MVTRADRVSPRDKKDKYFSDFLMNLDRNPISGEISVFTNERAVVRSIRNLIRTNKGERMHQPSIGCNLRKLLFEPADDATRNLIRTSIVTTIEQHEPRVALRNIDIVYDESDDSYNITLIIALINVPSDLISFSMVLKRVR